ncbi:3-hydroxyisobutyryl-CoA hydrolase [Yarrowia sp. C11]|nr:3-hydroxyisobutyryl-CoA hydrolase [Yarrowia sp. E02]KAG5369402.1 3-hydroxyisobutyryl-CoA hydrolase [Yarrowia sp. C11]
MLRTLARTRMPLRAHINTRFMSQTTAAAEESPVLFNDNGTTRTITLNRPKKLNALDDPMCRAIFPRLKEWLKSDSAKVVLFKGAGNKAFCAGGDVATLAKQNAAGAEGIELSRDFFCLEYAMDYLLAVYPKPVIALNHGITMGGGLGVSMHLPFRVATETTLSAMPETSIGFFCDVGGTFFLPRLDGELGTFLALTSSRLKGYEAVAAGFATHYIPSARLPELEKAIASLDVPKGRDATEMYAQINALLNDYSEVPANFKFQYGGEFRALIDRTFKYDAIEDIVAALKQEGEAGEKIIKLLGERSPTSVKVTLAALRRGRNQDIQGVFNDECNYAENFMHSREFIEGVSAKLIDKPAREPKWEPSTFEGVTPEIVKSFIQQRGDSKNGEMEVVINDSYKQYPWNFGLPREVEIEQYIKGETRSSDYKASPAEVVNHFTNKYSGKPGVSEKVKEVLLRKTKPDPSEPKVLDWVN